MTDERLNIPLRDIDDCFQGTVPSAICSVAADGRPNITYISIVHRLSDTHIGLSRQFFNKTIANMSVNPRVQVEIIEPTTGRSFRIDAVYERTETEGWLFDYVSARLDAIASQTGMSGIFKLASVDICKVVACRQIPSDLDIAPPVRPRLDLPALDRTSRRITAAVTSDELITVALDSLVELGYEHVILLLPDEKRNRLYTVASRGYGESGAGSEVSIGDGIIGVSAERRQIINLGNIPADITYSRTIRAGIDAGPEPDIERDIPLPGLANAVSQLAVPLEARGRLLGLFCLQSEQPGRFGSDDEAIVSLIARQAGLGLSLLGPAQSEEPEVVAAPVAQKTPAGPPARVRHYAEDDSVFIDNEYLIKGVAGRVLWRLLENYCGERRVEFSNKEIRLDPSLDLPDIKDNLEARLILLKRRLDDRCGFLRITNTGRGRFRLDVQREITLQEVAE
jgi:adenylate cyclase